MGSNQSNPGATATYGDQTYKPPTIGYDDQGMARVQKADRVIIPVDRGKESLRAFNCE